MACSDPRYQHLLADAVLGRLSAGEMFQVQSHLRSCASCRDAFKAGAILAGKDYEALLQEFGEHFSEEDLAKYYADREQLKQSQLDAIESHLEVCTLCRGELRLLEQVERELVTGAAAQRHATAGVESTSDRVRSVLLHPVFAAAVLIIVAMPVIMQWQGGKEQLTPATPGIPQAIELKESSRSAGVIQTVAIFATDNYLHLRIPYPHQVDTHRYFVTIRREEDSQSALASVWLRYSQAGKIDALMEADSLMAGRYELKVLDIGSELPIDTLVTTFLFNVEVRK